MLSEVGDGSIILTENRAKMDEIAEILLEKETLTREEFLALISGEATIDDIRRGMVTPPPTPPPTTGITVQADPEPPRIQARLRPEPA